MTIVSGRLVRKKTGKPTPRWALGLGSIAPDIALYFLSFGAIWYFGSWQKMPRQEMGQHIFQNLYYNDPVWITLHNFFHSPTMLAILFVLVWWASRSGRISERFSRWCNFFLAACLFHSIVDILTHNDDGPVLFYPFNWTYRFSSPISYWDTDHYAKPFMIFEAALDLMLIGLLVWWRIKERD